jgi:hypothetical protein
VILAELELFHSRPIAPTRRVALGHGRLPVESRHAAGTMLLAGVVARFVPDLDPDLVPDLDSLVDELERGDRIAQPRLRYRFQRDRVGLTRTTHRLVQRRDEAPRFVFQASRAAPSQSILAAVYAAAQAGAPPESHLYSALRRAVGWPGGSDADLFDFVAGSQRTLVGAGRTRSWALDLLGLDGADLEPQPDRADVQKRFRELLLVAHPDQGGEVAGAADRIADLTAARTILLAG